MSKPPSDFARLVLFCELVDEYDDLALAFPIEQTDLHLIPSKPEPAIDHWARVVRAMALRKFALSKGDHVYVPTVLDSAEKCLTDPARVSDIRAVRTRFESLGQLIKIHEGPSSDDEWSTPGIIEDLIYGGLLHGDYGRHERVKIRPAMTHDLSLWTFTVDVEPFVRLLRTLIRREVDQGILADRTASPL